MARKGSQELNAALAASIRAQPVSAVQAAIEELRSAGLNDDANALSEVLAEREQQLADARAAKEREGEAARQRAIADAQAEFAAKAAAYVVLRDEALEALRVYVRKAAPGKDAYGEMQAAANALDLLTGGMAERPASATTIFNSDPEFRNLVAQPVTNTGPLNA
jgi:hypothetical protein